MDRRNAAATGGAKHRPSRDGGGLCGLLAVVLLATPAGLLYGAWRAWQAVATGYLPRR